MIKAGVKTEFSIQKLFIKDDLLNIARRIIVPTMQKNIDDEVALDGKALPPIEASTIKRKLKKGLSPKILTETGTLRTAFVVTSPDERTVKVTIDSRRKEIGGFLQIEGIRSNKGRKYFNFFGISSVMEKNAIAYMKQRIKDAKKNAR